MHPLRRLWSRLLLRGVTHRDRYGQLGLLYLLRDPWSLDSPHEQFRFEQTNRIILGAFGRTGSILELGCGEGHQSEHLKACCDTLYGVDVSRRAVRRAGRRAPDCTFLRGTLPTVASRFSGSPVDLVTACEVLYYCEDVATNIELMSRVARHCLVTCYQTRAARVGPHLEKIAGVASDTIEVGSHLWHVWWWASAGADTPSLTPGGSGPSRDRSS